MEHSGKALLVRLVSESVFYPGRNELPVPLSWRQMLGKQPVTRLIIPGVRDETEEKNFRSDGDVLYGQRFSSFIVVRLGLSDWCLHQHNKAEEWFA